MGSQASGFHPSLMPHLSLISHLRSRLYLLKGKQCFLRLPGAPCWEDVNYICMCTYTCACSTQQEIWDGEQLGYMSGPSLLGNQARAGGAPVALSRPRLSLALRCLLARALVGTEWPLAHGCC